MKGCGFGTQTSLCMNLRQVMNTLPSSWHCPMSPFPPSSVFTSPGPADKDVRVCLGRNWLHPPTTVTALRERAAVDPSQHFWVDSSYSSPTKHLDLRCFCANIQSQKVDAFEHKHMTWFQSFHVGSPSPWFRTRMWGGIINRREDERMCWRSWDGWSENVDPVPMCNHEATVEQSQHVRIPMENTI